MFNKLTLNDEYYTPDGIWDNIKSYLQKQNNF